MEQTPGANEAPLQSKDDTQSLPEIEPTDLPNWVGSKRRPCVLRGIGSELDLAKGLQTAAVDDDGEGGIRWLAGQTGTTIFRVFVSGPVGNGDGGGDSDVDGISSSPATFTLDGTDHPDSILTTSMSRLMTLDEMINCGKDQWRNRYMVEDELPSDGPVGRLVPSVPPPLVAAAFDGSSGSKPPSPSPMQRQLFASIGSCQTQVHRDCYDNIYVCALGERHWSVAPPNDAWEREGGSVSASVQPPPSLADGCKGKAPTRGFARVALTAGDAMFVPAHWWHSVRSGSGASVAINWYYDSAPTESDGDFTRGGKRRKVKE